MLSGGIDSTVCLAQAIKIYGKSNVIALSFDYGQNNIKELLKAREICQYYKVEHNIIDIKNIFKDKEEIPFKNGVLLSICTSYALTKKSSVIYYGIHEEENRKLYPDCSSAFDYAMDLAIYTGTGKKVSICSPLIDMTKREIIKLGTQLKIPFELTWSCHENNDLACGKCEACMDRLKGFEDNNLLDRIKYESRG